MNVEKLSIVVRATIEEIGNCEILTHLPNIISMLNNLVSQPNSSYQQNLTASVVSLRERLASSKYDSFSPSFRQILKEIAPNMILGNALLERVTSIIERNQITLQLAVNELNLIFNEISQFHSNGGTFFTSLSVFGISGSDLAPGECEVGFLVPRAEIKNDFRRYQEELKELDLILNTFSEFVTGEIQSLDLRSTSSSDPMVYVGVAAAVAVAIAKSIEWIVATYKNIVEIKVQLAELKRRGLPENSLKGIEDHSNDVMKEDIKKILQLLQEQHCGVTESARQHELLSGLGICLNKIANRIDRGFGFEVRVGELPAPKNDEDEEDRKKLEVVVSTVKQAEANISFMNLDGPRLLSLQESDSKAKK